MKKIKVKTMEIEMQIQGRGRNNNLPNNDDTIPYNGTGPGTISFKWNHLGEILFQAFTASVGRASNISLLPKKFVFKTYQPRSCCIVRNKCLPPGQNYENDLCAQRWRLLRDTGKTGSKYFLSANEDFIIKTIEGKEHDCLIKILPRLCHFLTDNKETLLPRFFGLHSYKGGGKTIRFMIMNNLLPNHPHIDKRFDLKGATKRKRAANVGKDDEFIKTHPQGFKMDVAYVCKLRELCELDCMHLRDLELTNYSLFIAVHEVHPYNNGDQMRVYNNNIDEHTRSAGSLGLLRYRSRGVQGEVSNHKKVLLYIGFIHILQPYTFGRKVEHFFKSILPGGNKAPVQPPREFETRFMDFVTNRWFRPF